MLREEGFFAGPIDDRQQPFRYRLRMLPHGSNSTYDIEDPYRFGPVLGELDIHLLVEGTHLRAFEKLGAHVATIDDIVGATFAVWAPNARKVSVVGDFNEWDGRRHPMRCRFECGVWEIFLPGVAAGDRYKYEIKDRFGNLLAEKADPFGVESETPPKSASIVPDPTPYVWSDGEWMRSRAHHNDRDAPVAIYEVHLGSWKRNPEEGNRYLTYRELADDLVPYARDLGFTHIELMPIHEHPFDGSWGYQPVGLFAPTSRYGKPNDFKYFIDKCHQAGLGILIDWVAGHFPNDAHGLVYFDGTHLYEHSDPRKGEHREWGTLIYNYGRREVSNFLLSNALYWMEEFHVDGLRVDAVASMLYLDYSRRDGEWVPNQYGGRENLEAVSFLQEVNATVYKRVPGAVTVAEESTAWPGVTRPTHLGGLGFGFKWNLGWMHDTLGYISHEPIHRQYHHHEMTFSMMYAYSENYVLPISHDEVVHGKGSLLNKVPGDRWQQMATVRALYAYMWAHPGKQLLFMGQEFAQDEEWSESRSLEWWLLDRPDHRGVARLVGDLNYLYRNTSALWSQDHDPAGFGWIDADDVSGNVFSFLRYGADGSIIACVANFAAVPHEQYRLGLPRPGRWDEVINTDADVYFGSGVGNFGGVDAVDSPAHGQPASVRLRVPPLGTLWLRFAG
jgi:1,4-alpha-glucan branching enzyme